MPDPNAVISTVIRFEPPLDRPLAEMLRREPGLSVELEGERRVRLDPADPRSIGFAQVLDGLSKRRLPVYVEVDPETSVITRLLIPHVTRIIGIRSTSASSASSSTAPTRGTCFGGAIQTSTRWSSRCAKRYAHVHQSSSPRPMPTRSSMFAPTASGQRECCPLFLKSQSFHPRYPSLGNGSRSGCSSFGAGAGGRGGGSFACPRPRRRRSSMP